MHELVQSLTWTSPLINTGACTFDVWFTSKVDHTCFIREGVSTIWGGDAVSDSRILPKYGWKRDSETPES